MKISRIIVLLLAFAFCIVFAGISEAEDATTGYIDSSGLSKPFCPPNEPRPDCIPTLTVTDTTDQQQENEATRKQKMKEEKQKLLDQQNPENKRGYRPQNQNPIEVNSDGWVVLPRPREDSTSNSKLQSEIQKMPPDEMIPGKIPPPDPRPLPVPDQGRERPKFKPGDGTGQAGGPEK